MTSLVALTHLIRDLIMLHLGVVELLHQLAKLSTLEELNMSRTGLTDKCAAAMASLIQSESMRVVNASYSKFTPKGIKIIADALESSSLKVCLEMSTNPHRSE